MSGDLLVMKNWTQSKLPSLVLIAAVVPSFLFSCESAPGTKQEQGAVIGGVAGAVIGNEVGDGALGMLIGAALGAGGGWIAGGELDKLDEDEAEDAREAIDEAQRDPATADDVRQSSTADLNEDGYVTLDEVVALADAGLRENEILDRLERTDQVFELTEEQRDYLIEHGVPRSVTWRMTSLNQDARTKAGLSLGDQAIGTDR